MFDEECSVCCILTGASRGFGAALAIDIAKQAYQMKNAITFILVARSLNGLEKTKIAVSQIYSSAKVHCVSADLGNLSTLSSSMKNIFEKVKPSEYSTALLINNAAVLGDPSKRVQDFEDPHELQNHWNVNVSAPFFLMSKFIKAFSGSKRYIVCITTLLAKQEFAGLSFYCSSKAANLMAHKVMAKEEPDLRVLCYSPGLLDTDMADDLEKTIDMEIKKMLSKENTLKPEQSSAKLMNLLLEDKFKSGQQVDFFDC